MSSKTQQYTYHRLPIDEVVACLSEIGIEIERDDLKSPQSVVIRAVYQKLLQLLLYVSQEEIEQPDYGALDATIENAEMHQHSIPEMAFYRWLHLLMAAVQVEDFSRADVEAPRCDRTLEILSAVINFIKFREERLAMFEEYQRGVEELATLRDQKLQERADFDACLGELQRVRDAEAPFAGEIERECDALRGEVDELNERQAKLHDETSALKASLNDLLNDKSSMKLKAVNAKQDVARLSAQIVPEPDKLRRQLEEMEALADVERGEVRTLDATLKELHARGERFEKILKDVHRCLGFMEECGAELSRIAETKGKIAETRQAMGDAENELEVLRAQEAALRRQIQLQQEKSVRAAQKQEQKREMAAETLENVLQEQQQLEKENVAVREKVAGNEEEKKQIVLDMQAMREQHEQELTALFGRYDEVELKVRNYHQKLIRAMRPEYY